MNALVKPGITQETSSVLERRDAFDILAKGVGTSHVERTQCI